jgi:[histone H3]-lysine79 N-trimethyltransferase
MNLFQSKTWKIQKAAPIVRTERLPVPTKPAPLTSKASSTRATQDQRSTASSSRAASTTARSRPATPSSDDHSSSLPRPNKRKASRQRSPAQPHFDDDNDDDDDDKDASAKEPGATLYKRQKIDRKVDLKRRIRSEEAFSEAEGVVCEMIHAADIASVNKKSKFAASELTEKVTVELQYPSNSPRERFVLDINPTLH